MPADYGVFPLSFLRGEVPGLHVPHLSRVELSRGGIGQATVNRGGVGIPVEADHQDSTRHVRDDVAEYLGAFPERDGDEELLEECIEVWIHIAGSVGQGAMVLRSPRVPPQIALH